MAEGDPGGGLPDLAAQAAAVAGVEEEEREEEEQWGGSSASRPYRPFRVKREVRDGEETEEATAMRMLRPGGLLRNLLRGGLRDHPRRREPGAGALGGCSGRGNCGWSCWP